MIITKTPYRISFFGGGSDYPQWYEKFGGSVLSTTIDKHIYISCRFLPKFFQHKYRIVWSRIENVKNINEIKHKAVKGLLNYYNIKNGLEIHYDGDLPARSGMGSSSTFTVGLMRALLEIKKKKLSDVQLAKEAIKFEQKKMGEIVGSQDQLAASIGGLNKIDFFGKNKISIKKIKMNKRINRLENNLILIYSGIQRTAQYIASSYIKDLTKSKKNYIKKIMQFVDQGHKILQSGDLDHFGELLHEGWILKKKLSSNITNSKINQLYNFAMANGASGGKLLGAGGGGFLLMYMKQKYRKKFFSKNKNIVNVPLKFSDKGSEVIFKDLTK